MTQNNMQENEKHHVLSNDEINEMITKIEHARYDSVARFLTKLSIAFIASASKDLHLRNRPKLAQHLDRMGISLMGTIEECGKAWNICKKKMGVD